MPHTRYGWVFGRKEKQNIISSVEAFGIFLFFTEKIIINEHTKYRPLGETVGISLSPVSASRWFITDVWTVACILNFPSLSLLLLFLSFLFFFLLFFYTLTLDKKIALPPTAVIVRLSNLICRCQIVRCLTTRSVMLSSSSQTQNYNIRFWKMTKISR